MNQRDVLEKLAKWRTVFASWQLGTRSDTDPECTAVKDHREVTILLRAEVNALTALLIKDGVFTADEFAAQVQDEAVHLDLMYEKKFPGISTGLDGVVFTMPEAAETLRSFPP